MNFKQRSERMKTNKTQTVLYMYDYLLHNKMISQECLSSFGEISNKTFLRYIDEIRSFFSNYYIDFDIVYSRTTKQFDLVEHK